VFPDITEGGWSALIAGLIVSPHCVGMCGPLYCAFIPIKKPGAPNQETLQLAYHFGRVISYTTIGILAGSLSLGFVKSLDWDISKYLPWMLVAMLASVATGLDKIIFKPSGVHGKWSAKLVLSVRRLPGELATFGMGLLTPLLPCAPLYMVLWVALISGSPLFGAEVMLGFSLGTIPLLWLSQSQFLRNREKWSKRTVHIIQRGLAAVAAIIIIARLLWVGGLLSGGVCIAS
jgi:uncharacterized protein